MQDLSWPESSAVRVSTRVRLLECARLTSSACAGTAERSKSQQRGFSSCQKLNVFCCWSAFRQSRGGISSELQMCLPRTCFSLDFRRKIRQYCHDSICRDPPVHNASGFIGEKGIFRGKVRRLFSHRDNPRIISGQIDKLEGTDLMDAETLYRAKRKFSVREF